MLSRRLFSCSLLLVASCLVFLTQLGNPLAGGHSDEPLYIGIAREMWKQNEWFLPVYHGNAAFYKPPLLYWMMMGSFKVLSASSLFAARLPAAVCGVGTVLATAMLGKLLFGKKEGELAGWLTLTTIPGIVAYARGALMDIPLVFFITLSLYFGVRAIKERNEKLLMVCFVLIGITSLFKGPVGCLIPLFPVLWLLHQRKMLDLLRSKSAIFGMIIFFGVLLLWPAAVALRGYGRSWLHFFILQENLGKFTSQLDPTTHSTPISVIWIHLFSQFLPWSFFLLSSLLLILMKKRERNDFTLFLLIWIFTVVGIFMIPQKKLSHYTLPAIPACALLIAELVKGSGFLNKIAFRATALILGAAGGLLLILSRISGNRQDTVIILLSAAAFLVGSYFLVKFDLKKAAYCTAAFLFLFALGLPHLMSGLNLKAFRQIAGHQAIYTYHIDLSILGTALNTETIQINEPGEVQNLRGLLIVPKSEQVDFTQKKIDLPPPLLEWSGWKNHLRLLDLLQAVLSGNPQLIHEEIIAVKL